jgi:hypothetical protein
MHLLGCNTSSSRPPRSTQRHFAAPIQNCVPGRSVSISREQFCVRAKLPESTPSSAADAVCLRAESEGRLGCLLLNSQKVSNAAAAKQFTSAIHASAQLPRGSDFSHSEKTVPRKANDWVFASGHSYGRKPIWGHSLMRRYIRPRAQALGIEKTIG